MEKFYNSSGDPKMFKLCIKHLSFAVNMALAERISDTKIRILDNIILISVNDLKLEEKQKGEIIDLIPLEFIND